MSESISLLATIEAKGENRKNINKVRSLTEKDFQEYSRYISDLNDYEKENSLFELIQLNHKDFQSRVTYYTREYKININQGNSVYIDLNRHILNCLFSFRTYLDHSESRLKRKFGKNSKELNHFKGLTSSCYDNHFSYRFLYKLRNYAQHCGLPTGSIVFNENANGKSLKIKFLRNALLGKYDSWGKIVKSELEKQEEEFDLIPLLDELVDVVGVINREMDSIIIKGFQSQAFHLLSLIDEAQKKETGTPCILKFIPGNKKSDFKIGWFPIQIISKVTGIKIVE